MKPGEKSLTRGANAGKLVNVQSEGSSTRTSGLVAGRPASTLDSFLISGLILIVGLVLLIIQRGPPGI